MMSHGLSFDAHMLLSLFSSIPANLEDITGLVPMLTIKLMLQYYKSHTIFGFTSPVPNWSHVLGIFE